MARPSNPNKEKITALKADLKEVNKVVRSGETAAKKKAKLEEKLAKLSGDTPAPANAKTQKVAKAPKASKTEKTDKAPKSSKKDKEKDKTKAKLAVVKRGRPRKNTDEDED